jgi:hypothetical protein
MTLLPLRNAAVGPVRSRRSTLTSNRAQGRPGPCGEA